jgi:hypothetical protein
MVGTPRTQTQEGSPVPLHACASSSLALASSAALGAGAASYPRSSWLRSHVRHDGSDQLILLTPCSSDQYPSASTRPFQPRAASLQLILSLVDAHQLAARPRQMLFRAPCGPRSSALPKFLRIHWGSSGLSRCFSHLSSSIKADKLKGGCVRFTNVVLV